MLLPVSRRPNRIRTETRGVKVESQVTAARMTHIMWLTNLAPEIQEAILFLPRVESGPDTVKEIDVRRITRLMDWGVQRRIWKQISAKLYCSRSR